MSIPVVGFFNNKGGVGKTSLVYHVSWMLSDLGFRVVAADLDPQGNLTTAFVDDNRLEELWSDETQPATIFGAIRPIMAGVGDIRDPVLEVISERLALIPGDMALSQFEDDLSQVWPKCLDRDERAFRVISAFWRAVQRGGENHNADVIVIDLGPNLGAINRSALIASDCVVIPLGPDLFSLQGLRNLGPTLGNWRRGWAERLTRTPTAAIDLPSGTTKPLGYIVIQHSVRRDRPVQAYDKWIGRIPSTYGEFVLDTHDFDDVPVTQDPHCLALLKHYRSLMPMAQEARKPMFHLKPADGALGAHIYAVQGAYKDFQSLTKDILRRAGIRAR